jgi:hypothetical protein
VAHLVGLLARLIGFSPFVLLEHALGQAGVELGLVDPVAEALRLLRPQLVEILLPRDMHKVIIADVVVLLFVRRVCTPVPPIAGAQ